MASPLLSNLEPPSPSSSAAGKVTLHVEVQVLPQSKKALDFVSRCVKQWLTENFISLTVGSEIFTFANFPFLRENVAAISVAEATGSTDESLPLDEVDLKIYSYRHHPPLLPSIATEDGEDPDDHPSATILDLPANSLAGAWEYLVFDQDIKSKLLHFIYTIILFADKRVNFKCISMNRLILLHGPPGCGKTTLCRALAQKISIRLSSRYPQSKLVEINTHTLFSKWFSESSKLVGKMFDDILAMLDDEDTFILVLIDEVESLASIRNSMASGGEPADSLRAVNVLLTALDKLRERRNVIVLTTSNLLDAMDPAFIDRADIKQFIGYPTAPTCYMILRACLNELIRCQIIETEAQVPACAEARLILYSEPDSASSKLWHISKECARRGMSGRALKRLPVIMHSEWIQKDRCTIGEALEGLRKCIWGQTALEVAQ